MEKRWSDEAWADYLWWLEHDRKVVRRINDLIKSAERDPTQKPTGRGEILAGGVRSMRIDKKNRLSYVFEDGSIRIISCRGHYGRN